MSSSAAGLRMRAPAHASTWRGCWTDLGRPADAVRERARGEQALRDLRAARAEAGLLTTREREVLALVAQGLSNPEIAQRLVLSTHTVHRHVANLMRKLGVSSRIAAASRGSELGLI